MDGHVLHFRLAGINNQNFIMRDEETGSWWQQISGTAIQGPLKGKQLAWVAFDEVSFAIWKQEHPAGQVLLADAEFQKKYAKPDWELRMLANPTVTPIDPKDPLKPRDLVIGVTINKAAKAYPMLVLLLENPIVDSLGSTPILLVAGPDGRSVRCFERMADGQTLDLFLEPNTNPLRLVDAQTGSRWDFSGTAVRGPLAGKRLKRMHRRPEFETAKLITEVGRQARYEHCTDEPPDNETIWMMYRLRCMKEPDDVQDPDDRFLVPGVPLFFLIPPRSQCFSVRFRTVPGAMDETALAALAADFGFDWHAFRSWRENGKAAKYYASPYWESGVRVLCLTDEGGDLRLDVQHTNYRNYLCTEGSVNLVSPDRQLPDFRRFFEGDTWESGGLDLTDLSGASARYDMRLSVQAALITSDDYLVLARRSHEVKNAKGGIGSTAAGGALYNDVVEGLSRGYDLFAAVLRELKEETGVAVNDLLLGKVPGCNFCGAAFNLRYGRDLNFYAYLETCLRFDELEKLRSDASDRWEVAHLVPVPIDCIDVQTGNLTGKFAQLLGNARHVRGVLRSIVQLDTFRRRVERASTRGSRQR